MWRHVVLFIVSLCSPRAHAYAPIQTRGYYVVMPEGRAADSTIVHAPHRLILRDPADVHPPNVIAQFRAQLDQTISSVRMDDMVWCIEAEGFQRGDAVRVNLCTGRPNQKWNWVPDGQGRNMIQLKDTNLCFDVASGKDGMNAALVELQECKNKQVDAWTFKQRLPSPAMPHSSAVAADIRSRIISFITCAVIGLAGLGGWLWKWQRGAHACKMILPGVFSASATAGCECSPDLEHGIGDGSEAWIVNGSKCPTNLQVPASSRDRTVAVQLKLKKAPWLGAGGYASFDDYDDDAGTDEVSFDDGDWEIVDAKPAKSAQKQKQTDESHANFTRKEIVQTVPSLRVDAVVSAGLVISRSKAKAAADNGLVLVNGVQVKSTKAVSVGDVITKKGKDRAEIEIHEVATTKKGKFRLTMSTLT